MEMSLKAVLIIVISIGFVAAAIDYCDIQTRFCKGKPHVACNMTKAASVPTCQNQKRISFNDAQQQKFIKRINNYRNEFAAGRVNNFKPASRMATMVYDPELAYLAYHNLEECGYNYDKCRATAKCPYAGRSSYWYNTTKTVDIDKRIERSIDRIFEQNTWINQAMLDNFTALTNKKSGNSFSTFSVMMRDSGISVGCSALTYSESGGSWNNSLIIGCIYCANNMMGRPIYVSADKPAAGCKTGTNPEYPALCSIDEVYTRIANIHN